MRAGFSLALVAAIVATGILSLFPLARLRRTWASIARRRRLRQPFAAALVTPLTAPAALIMGHLVSAWFSAAARVGQISNRAFAAALFGNRLDTSAHGCGRTRLCRLCSKPRKYSRQPRALPRFPGRDRLRRNATGWGCRPCNRNRRGLGRRDALDDRLLPGFANLFLARLAGIVLLGQRHELKRCGQRFAQIQVVVTQSLDTVVRRFEMPVRHEQDVHFEACFDR